MVTELYFIFQRNFIDGDSFRIVFAILPTDDECENVNRPMHSGELIDISSNLLFYFRSIDCTCI